MREFGGELYKTVRRPAVWVCVFVLLAIAVTLGYALPWLAETFSKSSQGLPPGTTLADFKVTLYPQNFVLNTLGNPLGGVLALIIGVLLQGSEYGWGTVKMLYTQRAGRLAMLFGKLGALAVLVVIMVIGLFAVDAASSVAAALLDGQTIEFPEATQIIKGMAAMALVFGMWAAFGFVLATLFRQSAMAIGLGLAYTLVVEGLIFGFGSSLVSGIKNVQQWFPIANTGYLAESFGSVKIHGVPLSPPPFADATHAVLVLTTYLVAFVVISAVLLRRRDVTS